MILKVIIFGIFLVSCASAQDLEKLLKQAVTHRGYEDNPCTGRNDAHWAKNNRGCSWFYTCGANNVLIEQNRCEEGRHFSFEYQACGFKGEVPCNIPDIPAECPSNNFGILVVPHQYSCSKYTVCFDGVENDRDCEPGLHFSPFDQECVDPFMADCNREAHSCAESVESGLAKLLPNSRDCQAFFVCIGDRLAELRCAPKTHFVLDNGWCEPEEIADCTPVKPDDMPRIPDMIAIDCEGISGRALPHPDSCEFFFFCAGDRSYLQVCGSGTVFDIPTNRCQLRDTAFCSTDHYTTTAPPTTGAPTTTAELTTTTAEETTTTTAEETTTTAELTTTTAELTTTTAEETTTTTAEETTTTAEETTT